MTIIGFLCIGILSFVFVWAGVSKIILEELDRHCRTYRKVNTLYYNELQSLQSRISIMPSFLWEATKLILAIEKEESDDRQDTPAGKGETHS